MSRWVDAVLAAGAVPASHVPEESAGRTDVGEIAGAEVVEGSALSVLPVEPGAAPPTVSFLDGIQRWTVAYYDGVAPIVRAHVAAAVRRRSGDRRPRTAGVVTRDFHAAPLRALRPAVRAALEATGIELLDVAEDAGAQPGRAIEAARGVVEQARSGLERELGERQAKALDPAEWLIVDGVLSDSRLLAAHPRALGVIKSHAAQYFEGATLTRALTLPALHRTSVFRPRGRGHHEVFSWYLRLWPWEGNDLLFGLVRIEAPPTPAAVAGAGAASGWLVRERAPVSTPDPRWDRLLYPMHDVETYLKARAPRDPVPLSASRLPRTGS